MIKGCEATNPENPGLHHTHNCRLSLPGNYVWYLCTIYSCAVIHKTGVNPDVTLLLPASVVRWCATNNGNDIQCIKESVDFWVLRY